MKTKEDLIEDKVEEILDIQDSKCRDSKRECLTSIIKQILITSDECCDKCSVCRELNGCVLTRINDGLDNIFGSINSEEL